MKTDERCAGLEQSCATIPTHISILITTRCTLNCRLCSSGIPYYKEPRHAEAGAVVMMVHSALRVYRRAGIPLQHLDLLGGEPLLHPQLAEIITEICRLNEEFPQLRVLTNGTIVPGKALLDTLAETRRKRDVLVLISNYGKLSVHFDEVCSALEAGGIPYRVDQYTSEKQNYGGWVAYRAETALQGSPQSRYEQCAFSHSGGSEIYENRLFPCTSLLSSVCTGRHDPLADEYIDLNGDEEENAAKLLAIIHRTRPYSLCERCSGLGAAAKRYPAAEQVEKGRI